MKNTLPLVLLATVAGGATNEELEARVRALEEQSAAAEATIPTAAADFSFHSYFRAGLGVNGNGDPMEAFQAPNSGAKYRLGNEAEAYIEATFQQHFRAEELVQRGIDFYAKMTFAYVTPTSNNNTFDTSTSLREAYAAGRGVWDAQKDALFWAGNRFYEHLDIHMNDFFFRDMAGFGGGIEDVALGDDLKWAAAWLGGSIDELDSAGTAYEKDYNFNKNTLDLRLYGIRTGVGALALSFDLAHFGGDILDDGVNPPIRIEDSLGWAAGAFLTSALSPEMSNRLTLQYGTGAADNFRAVITAPLGVDLTTVTTLDTADTKRLRVTDDIVIENGTPMSLQTAAVYERYDNGVNGTVDWASLGARPIYHFNDFFSLAFEGGIDYTNHDGAEEGVLGKFTLAPQIQPARQHFSRPVIRAFLTYALWSNGFEGSVAAGSYATEQQGVSAGVQMEAWW